jgi:two-component system LytT family sensor kinase
MSEIGRNYRQLALILLCMAIGIVCYVGLSFISGMLTINSYQPNLVGELSFLLLKVWLPWALLSPLVLFFTQRFPITPTNWLPMIAIHFTVLMMLILLQTVVISYYYHFFGSMSGGMETYQPWQHMGHFLFGDGLFLFHVVFYTVFVASQNLRNFYSVAEEKELESARLSKQLMASKLHALRMQINPHFLFNTLNIITVLVLKEEKNSAAELLEKLSTFFRQTLEESEAQWVPLKREVDIIEQYLFIERARFGDRLNIQLEIEPVVCSISVPSMILQPLVENAVSHGIGEKIEPGLLTVIAKKVGGRLLIQVKDNGVGCDFNSKGYKPGIGLENVRQRLEQMYGDRHIFNLEGELGKGVCITIELPVDTHTGASK